MTASQRTRLHDIIESLRRWKLHPNPREQLAAGDYSDQEITQVIKAIQAILEEDDGYLAFGVIRSWSLGTEQGVMKKLLGKPLPSNKTKP